MKLSLTSIMGLALVGALLLTDTASAGSRRGCRRSRWMQFGLACQASCGCGGAGYAGAGVMGGGAGGYGTGALGVGPVIGDAGGYPADGSLGGPVAGGVGPAIGDGGGILADGSLGRPVAGGVGPAVGDVGGYLVDGSPGGPVAGGVGPVVGDAGGYLADGYLGGPVAGDFGPGAVAGAGRGMRGGGGAGGGGAVYGPEAWAGAEERALAQWPPPPPPAWRTLAGHADRLEWVPHPDHDEHPRASMLKVEAPIQARVYLDGRELKQGTDGAWRYAPKEPLMLHLENVHTVRAEVDYQGQKFERWVTFRLQAGKLTRVVFE